MTKRLVIANWKMNGSLSLLADVDAAYRAEATVDVVVLPPAIYAKELVDRARGRYQVGIQNVSQHYAGAHTGEISASMAAEVGVSTALVGHSERRIDNDEDDAVIAAKCQQLILAGLMPVICVGETLAEREAGQAEARVQLQVNAQLECLRAATDIAIAYEPIWAIGTGKSASVDEAVVMHQSIRRVLQDIVPETAEEVRILYGGSVNGSNAQSLFSRREIQGVLVGGASLDTEQFAAIIRAARG